MNISSVTTQIIGIVMLIFTISLSFRNPIVEKFKMKGFILVCFLTKVMLTIEIIETYIISLKSTDYVLLHKLIMIVAFIIMNFIIYILLSLNDNGRFSKSKLLLIPLAVNIAINIATYWTGWIFYIDAGGNYTRGDYYYIQMSINIFYYILLTIAIFINDIDYDKDDIQLLSIIFALPIIAAIIQIVYPEYYLIWVSTALSLMLYYIFLRELQFKFDMISGIKNRRAFNNKMNQLCKSKKDAAIVVLDLNDLKKINDSKGHEDGDKVIYNFAQLLQDSFKYVGVAYRTGGDEFCVICVNTIKEQLEASFKQLEDLLEKYNIEHDLKIAFAYGYEFYSGEGDIFKIFEIADKKMYEYKSKIKGYYGRRREDQL